MPDLRLIELKLVKDDIVLTDNIYQYKWATHLSWSVQLPPSEFYATIVYDAELCGQADATKVLQRHLWQEARDNIQSIIEIGVKLKNLQQL